MPEIIQFSSAATELAHTYTSPAFEEQFTYAGALGVEYTPLASTFRVWSPTAESVTLCLYAQGDGGKAFAKHRMERQDRGVWQITLDGDLASTFYTYAVTNFGKTVETVDLYARAVGVNGQRGMVVNLWTTNPIGWESDSFTRPQNATDAVVWELHVGDFSNDPHSGVRKEWQGKYLAFTETGTTLDNDGETPTCLNYLRRLGVTHVQLLPIFDFASVNEAGSKKQFNWGYDPLNYNVPEGSYATDPTNGRARIAECKAMIRALHGAGIGVIMDVVYNHTFAAAASWFHRTVPYYYHRTTADGKFADGSACSNETASERFMCRRFIIDSVLYWAQEYHIDGFRFDLMGLHDVETMNLLRAELDKLPNGRQILLYGEPWAASAPAMPEGVLSADKSNVRALDAGIGVFSDNTRDAIKGDVFRLKLPGFANGGAGFENAVKASLQGWVQGDFAAPYANAPSQVVSYVSAHDNLTLWDKLAITTGVKKFDALQEDLVAMNKLCAVLYLMAQGMPFLQAGEEFARSKYGDENSYKSSQAVNALDWRRAEKCGELTDYYRGLLQIRKAFSCLRDPTPQSAQRMTFSATQQNVVAFTLREQRQPYRTITVCCNAGDETAAITLTAYAGETLPQVWEVIADGNRAGLDSLGLIQGDTIKLAARTAMILVGM